MIRYYIIYCTLIIYDIVLKVRRSQGLDVAGLQDLPQVWRRAPKFTELEAHVPLAARRSFFDELRTCRRHLNNVVKSYCLFYEKRLVHHNMI